MRLYVLTLLPLALVAAVDRTPHPAPPHPTTSDSAAPVRLPPALLVKLDGDKPSEPLSLTGLDVDVVINGYLSRTSMTMRCWSS